MFTSHNSFKLVQSTKIMEIEIFIALISFISLISGALIGVFGQILSNWLEHKKKINFLMVEVFFKRRLEYLEKLGYEVEKAVERHSKIFFLINDLNKLTKTINSKKISPKEIKSQLGMIIIKINEENLENFKPLGKAMYFSDKSPLINKISQFVLNYAETIVLLRKFIDENLDDENLKNTLNISIQRDLENSKQLMDCIKKEILIKVK